MKKEKSPIKGYILLGATIFLIILIGAFVFSTLNQPYDGPFVGSKNSYAYHYPSCYHVERIKEENKIWFNTATDARNQGYRACKDCRPP